MTYLGVFGLEIENYILIFEIYTLDFFQKKSLVQKLKLLNLGPRIAYLGVLHSKFGKLLS